MVKPTMLKSSCMVSAAILLTASIAYIFPTLAIANGQWLPIDNNKACSLWNRAPEPGDMVYWTGPCVNGVAHGHGTRYWRWKKEGLWVEEFYTGTMVNGRLEGIGASRLSKGGRYAGSYKNGFRHGKGRYLWKSGSKYIGEYVEGQRNGNGLFIIPSRLRYEGQYKNGKRNGFGKLSKLDGEFQGTFKDGKKHGYGKMTWRSGREYEGDWNNGAASGSGILTWPNGDQLIGEFSNGLAQGKGTIMIGGIKRFSGDFDKHQIIRGQGTYFDKVGNICKITKVNKDGSQAGSGKINNQKKSCTIAHGFKFEFF